MELIRGRIKAALKICLYGVEGIGKSTFASQFPDPLFIDTEGSTTHMSVMRTQRPSSWTMLIDQVTFVRNNPSMCKTLIIDTGDWAEMLCMAHICAKAKVDSIEAFGYGKGYTMLEEEFGRFLNLLQEVINTGNNVVITGHAQMRKFEQPDEMGAYDRWELKLEKKTSALVKEWADLVLFANYKTYVINVDNQGAAKGKNKAQGGTRVMYTTHHPCWDAKNRHNLPEELPFEYAQIAGIISGAKPAPEQPAPAPVTATATPTATQEAKPDEPALDPSIPTALRDLMLANNVSVEDIQKVVAKKGYYPQNTPISNYDQNFIDGVLVGAWKQVYSAICENNLPFEA